MILWWPEFPMFISYLNGKSSDIMVLATIFVSSLHTELYQSLVITESIE